MGSPDKGSQRSNRRVKNWLAGILSAVVGVYLLAYMLNSAMGGYWLEPARDGQHRFRSELGGLSIADAIMWQPRFGRCFPGHIDRMGLLFAAPIQIDQWYFHKTHYLLDSNYVAWLEQLA